MSFYFLKAISVGKRYVVVGGIVTLTVFGLGGWYLFGQSNVSNSKRHQVSRPSAATGGSRSSTNGGSQGTKSSPSPAASTPTPPSKPTGSAASSSKTSSPVSSHTPSTPTPASSPPPAAYSCVTSAVDGHCPFSAVSYITGASADPYVDQNVWNGGGGYQQTLYANSPKDWYITANANTNFGGVLTYPNTGFSMDGAVDGFSSITSSWNVTIPTNAQTAGWAAYDLWFNNWNDEVMIQTDITANSFYDCTGVATITVSGIPWHMCDFGSERVWKPGTDDQHLINRTSGSVDVKAFLIWMEQNGKLPAGSTWTAGSFGFEVCDTGGATETFRVNGFSWSAQ